VRKTLCGKDESEREWVNKVCLKLWEVKYGGRFPTSNIIDKGKKGAFGTVNRPGKQLRGG